MQSGRQTRRLCMFSYLLLRFAFSRRLGQICRRKFVKFVIHCYDFVAMVYSIAKTCYLFDQCTVCIPDGIIGIALRLHQHCIFEIGLFVHQMHYNIGQLSASMATPHANDRLWLFANAFVVDTQLTQVALYHVDRPFLYV